MFDLFSFLDRSNNDSRTVLTAGRRTKSDDMTVLTAGRRTESDDMIVPDMIFSGGVPFSILLKQEEVTVIVVTITDIADGNWTFDVVGIIFIFVHDVANERMFTNV
jgi:hypothetical protein